MGNLKSILTKLNKTRSEGSKLEPLSQKGEDFKNWTFFSTGSLILNNRLGGGVPRGALSIFTGWEGSGKTSMALLAAKSVTDKGLNVIFVDGENTLKANKNKFIPEDFGINMDLFTVIRDVRQEEVMDNLKIISTAEDVGMIVIDSVKSLTPRRIEEKSAVDKTMGVQAAVYGESIPTIISNCANNNISLIGINQWRNKLDGYGDPRTLPGGVWQKYYATCILEFKKGKLILDTDKNLIGNVIDTKIKKNKLAASDPNNVFGLKYIYNFGFDEYMDIATLAEEFGVIEKSGSWYTLPDIGDKIQGIASVAQFLEDNEEYYEFFKPKVTDLI